MTATKEQERNTLEKIKKMVAELGSDSYLAAAFTGAFDLAEQNIDDDAAFTTQYYIDQFIKSAGMEKNLKSQITTANAALKNAEDAYETTISALSKANEEAKKYAFEAADTKDRLDIANQEILKLKAKLYDYMVIPA